MKNSKKYAKKIVELYRSLRQKQPKVRPANFDDPLNAVVYAIISENIKLSAAKMISKRLARHFVDLNDLRVSRKEEILDVLGADNAESRKTASTLSTLLNAVFNQYDMVSLADLQQLRKRQAKKDLYALDGTSDFIVNFCFLTTLRGHSIPLTSSMIEYLKANDLVHPDASNSDISGFLERQISSADAYKFYWLLREDSEKPGKAVSKTSTGKAAKKTVKKSKKRKKTAGKSKTAAKKTTIKKKAKSVKKTRRS